MSKFVVIFHAPVAAMEQMAGMENASPEEMQAAMQPWMDWAARTGTALVDPGSPLMGGQTLSSSGNAPSDKGIVGYSMLEASDMQAAQALLANHPHLAWMPGCEIEVHETMHGPN